MKENKETWMKRKKLKNELVTKCLWRKCLYFYIYRSAEFTFHFRVFSKLCSTYPTLRLLIRPYHHQACDCC